jgi:hypothetical protein
MQQEQTINFAQELMQIPSSITMHQPSHESQGVKAGRHPATVNADMQRAQSTRDDLCSLTRLALQNKQRIALVLLRPCSSILHVTKVRRYHDLELLGGDAKIGQVVLRRESVRQNSARLHASSSTDLWIDVSDTSAREPLQHEKRCAILLRNILRKRVPVVQCMNNKVSRKRRKEGMQMQAADRASLPESSKMATPRTPS